MAHLRARGESGMKKNRWAGLGLTVLLMAAGQAARADGTFVAAPQRTDMVYDAGRDLIYIADGDRVERYDMVRACLLDPIVIGGQLEGIDLSPDGRTLAVADSTSGGTTWDDMYGWIHLVDTETLADTKVQYAHTELGEYGTYSVSFDRNGMLYVSTRFGGSGWTDLRRLDPASHAWTAVTPPDGQVTQDAMLAASGDGRVVGFAEANISDGRWGTYNVSTGELVRRQWYDDGTSAFNYEITVNSDGTQFSIPTYRGMYVYDGAYQKVATLGSESTGYPIAGAYHPVEAQGFFPWEGTGEVRVYDMHSFALLGSYDFEDTFQNPGITSYVQGRTRLSRDGSLLMVSVTGGVRFLRVYDALAARPLSLSSTDGRASVRLEGSIGNGGALTYSVQARPAHGRVTIDGDTATYTPTVGYRGEDGFDYAVHYGQAVAIAHVSVTVSPVDAVYSPRVSFQTLPALQVATPVPGSSRAPGDFNGDGTSDLLWFNPETSQVGYWTLTAGTTVKRTSARNFNVTPGYFVGAAGDLSGDGYADLVFTSAQRDLWLWTNSRSGGWRSTSIGSYPDAWQLVGAGDVDGDGYDDLLWVDPSDCQFGYWLMKGAVRKAARTLPITCGYYPIGLGYYTNTRRVSILWTSGRDDLYVWDSVGTGFRSYDLTGVTAARSGIDISQVWAVGGGVAGKGIGLEWRDASGAAYGATFDRAFDSSGRQSGFNTTVRWNAQLDMPQPGSAGYLIRAGSPQGTGLFVIDKLSHTIGAYVPFGADLSNSGSAPRPSQVTWTYPNGWYVVGAPANATAQLPWR